MNGRPENLAFLWRSMQLVPAVQRTQALCVQAQDEDLERIFRHHATEPIRRRDELDQRADMDWCLGVYSLLPVGVIAGYIGVPQNEDIKTTIQNTIGRESVRSYHEQKYPILLPHLLLGAIQGTVTLPVQDNEVSQGAFEWLVRFSSRFTEDAHLGRFLWLLDSGTFGGFGIKDLMAQLAKPDLTLQVLNTPDPPTATPAFDVARYGRFCSDDAELAKHPENQRVQNPLAILID